MRSHEFEDGVVIRFAEHQQIPASGRAGVKDDLAVVPAVDPTVAGVRELAAERGVLPAVIIRRFSGDRHGHFRESKAVDIHRLKKLLLRADRQRF